MAWFRPFFAGFFLITLFFGAVGFYIDHVPRQQMEQGQWVMHTHDVLDRLEALSKDLAQAAALQADYQRTHTQADYQHYTETTKEAEQTLAAIQTLTEDNPTQRQRIEPLRQSVIRVLDYFTQGMDPKLAVQSPSSPDKNAQELDAIARDIEAMRQEEDRLLALRMDRWHGAMLQTRMLFFGVMALLYLFALFFYKSARKDMLAREQLLHMETDRASSQQAMSVRLAQIVETQQEIIYQRLNLASAMEVITKRTQAITRADGGVIEILDGEDMVYRAASGTMAPYIGFRIKAKGSLSGLCVESSSALICEDTQTDDRVDKAACQKVGVNSMIVVPLLHRAKTVGVLKVASAKARNFTPEDLSTLQLMGGLLSATLHDATTTEALQDSHHHLTISNELLKTQKAQLESTATDLKARVDIDSMTGLKNHHYFQEFLRQEYMRARRYKNELSMLLIDVDHFKKYNDTYGHPAGDAVLKQLAVLFKKCTRPSDCVARYGGEEFAIILTQTSLQGAIKTAERIQEAVRTFSWGRSPITVSIGAGALQENTEDVALLVEMADKALYRSKTQGRNTITPSAA